MPFRTEARRLSNSRLTWATSGLWLGVSGLLVVGVLSMRSGLQSEVRARLIGRAAAVLQPMVQNQVDVALAAFPESPPRRRLVEALVANGQQAGLLAMAIFDADGIMLESVPAGRSFIELPLGDYLHLVSGSPISRYHAGFDLAQLPQATGAGRVNLSPVLEVVLPIRQTGRSQPLGFVRYHFDARQFSGELGVIDLQMKQQTVTIIGIGLLVLTGVFTVAYVGLRRARLEVDEGNASLARAEVNLTLSAKASALGQITSHLMHGLQGSVAGLQAAMGEGGKGPDWNAAQEYTKRVQSLVQETVELLNDRRSALVYELSGEDLAEIIRHRAEAVARDRAVALTVESTITGSLDNVRGNLVCLITSNLLQNAIAVSRPGQCVQVLLRNGPGASPLLQVEVMDAGPGVPEKLRHHLFEPGCSSRPGGTGLGLAISRLLAAQIEGDLTLVESGPAGSRFRLTIPLPAQRRGNGNH